MLKNEKKEVLHFSINTTQVPCCTPLDLTSLYFYKNNISIAKSSSLPLTQSFAVQLICLDHESFKGYSREDRLKAIHCISKEAIEEERSRRSTLLKLHESDDNRVVSSLQYRDLLNMNIDIFNSPHPIEPGAATPPVSVSSHYDFSPSSSNPTSPIREIAFRKSALSEINDVSPSLESQTSPEVHRRFNSFVL